MEIEALRASFPVCEEHCYLNAGTDGPLPREAVAAATAELAAEATHGRASAHFQRRADLSEQLRAGYAELLACEPSDVALSTCTTEGLAIVLDGLPLSPGDEILTSDGEHPGLLGALAVAREAVGVSVRVAPLPHLADAVGPRTRLVACSHVSWVSGEHHPARELAALEVPLLLDGAQGIGAVPTDVRELGCAAYAGAGQKWLCGPDGLGMLYVSPQLRERLLVRRRGYGNVVDPGAGLDAQLHEDARRFDTLSLNAETLAAGIASLRLLSSAGWTAIHETSSALAERLAQLLGERGRTVLPRAAGTLVSFSSEDPEGERERLAEHGIILRNIPGRGLLRASVGAWNHEADLQRLLAALAPPQLP
ncbi:MAG: aminotransferase class V-fold PLP-dependent enzyme [Solirubrobacteraceae bacterium]